MAALVATGHLLPQYTTFVRDVKVLSPIATLAPPHATVLADGGWERRRGRTLPAQGLSGGRRGRAPGGAAHPYLGWGTLRDPAQVGIWLRTIASHTVQ